MLLAQPRQIATHLRNALQRSGARIRRIALVTGTCDIAQA
jgi:hypothetical protein